MGKKFTQFTEDTSPDDGFIILGVDPVSGLSKKATRANFLGAEDIIDPTITGVDDGDMISGKFNGWVDSELSFAINASNGQREYVIRVSNDDVTDQIYVGQKIKFSRGVAAPTQCTDLEVTTLAQYWSKAVPTGVSFTDDYTAEAWIKPESYRSSTQGIITRYNSTGFGLELSPGGRIRIFGIGGASRIFDSYQSAPVGRWSHVAGTLDMSAGSGVVYLDGVSIPLENTGASGTSLTQAGPLQVGGENSLLTFDGKISDARLWNVVRTAAQIRDNMNQQLTGSETNLIGYWKFNGNGNDSTANANNLTANGTGATPTATDVDNPMHDTEYGIVTKVSFSTHTDITVFTGTDHNIPNMSISDLFYSMERAPVGFPATRGKWMVETLIRTDLGVSSTTAGNWYNNGQVSIPNGEWNAGYDTPHGGYEPASTEVTFYATLSNANNTESDTRFTAQHNNGGPSGTQVNRSSAYKNKPLSLSAQTLMYFNQKSSVNADSLLIPGGTTQGSIFAECAYL